MARFGVILVSTLGVVNSFSPTPNLQVESRHFRPTSERVPPLASFFGKSKAVEPPPPPPPPPSFFDADVRPPQRVAAVGALWVAYIAYAALGAPGQDAASQLKDTELIKAIIANPFDPNGVPFLTVVFNFMGIWPAWYAATLLPGSKDQKPVPALPFLGASLALGMFALSPYLALRERRPVVDASSTTDSAVGRWLEGKANGVLLAAGAVGLTAYGATANGGDLSASFAQYSTLFQEQLFVHVMSLDFVALWLLSPWVMAEDMERRGMAAEEGQDSLLSALPFAAVPILGHCAYLLARPPLLGSEEAE